MLPQQKLDALLNRHAMVEHELASPLSPEAYVHTRPLSAQLEVLAQAASRHRASGTESDDGDYHHGQH